MNYMPIDYRLVAGLPDSYIEGVNSKILQDKAANDTDLAKNKAFKENMADQIVQRMMNSPQSQVAAMGEGITNVPEASKKETTQPTGFSAVANRANRLRGTGDALMGIGAQKEAMDFYTHADTMDKESRLAAQERVDAQLKVDLPRLQQALNSQDEDAAKEILQRWSDHPDLKAVGVKIGDISKVKINSKKDLEVTAVEDYGDNELTSAITGKKLPAGRYEVKTITRAGNQIPQLVSIKPVDEKDSDSSQWKMHKNDLESKGYTKKQILDAWDNRISKRGESGMGGLLSEQRQMNMTMKQAEEERKIKDAQSKAVERTSKKLRDRDSWIKSPGTSEIKPEVLRSINADQAAHGLPPVVKKVETGRTEPGKVWGSTKLPDRIYYEPAEEPGMTATPPTGATGGGLSGKMPVPQVPQERPGPTVIPQASPMSIQTPASGGLSALAAKGNVPTAKPTGTGLSGKMQPVSQSPSGVKVMGGMNAKDYAGKSGTDTATGKRYRSNGIDWVEIAK
jgi:hypothetical protein